MSDTSRLTADSRPLSLEQYLDALCRRFEGAWQAGQRPQIEPYLSEAPPQAQAVLLRELVALELAHRRQAGESPTPEEYQRRFPGHAPLLAPILTRADDPRATRLDEPTSTTGARPQLPAGAARYLLLRPHAKGGLGEVYVAEDAELHREVALKRMQARSAQDPASRRRFLLEAEITGRLEHPGIVPVYGLVQDDNGQPSYAMRFIQGETLQQAIRRFHEAEQPGRSPDERRLALRQLLGRLIAVCNTVAYAHSRGVLHRDLKPANIMLGKYGETLVVDWGLAKPFGRTEAEQAMGEDSLGLTSRPDSAEAGAGTRTGAAVGTPAYMSPEQAAGRWNEVGPATDIYGLGATLYEILLNRPPVEGPSADEMLSKARRGEFLPPRQVQRGVPAGLEAVCVKAMSLKPTDRYATATELAADVDRWLADEPVTAYPDPLVVKLVRWGRRHKPVAAGLVVLFLTSFVGLAVGLWAVNRERKQTVTERDAKVLALEAEAEARKLTREALNTLTDEVVERLMARQAQLSEEDRAFLRKVLAFYQDLAAAQGDSPDTRASVADGHIRVATIRYHLGELTDAEQACRTAQEILHKLANDFPANPQYRSDLASYHDKLGIMLLERGRNNEAKEAHQAARDILRRLVEGFPNTPSYRSSLANTHRNLGNALERMGLAPAAEQAFRDALELARELVSAFPSKPEYHEHMANTHLSLGGLLGRAGRFPEAEEVQQAARDDFQKLVDDFPTNPRYRFRLAASQNNLGNLLSDTKRRDKAEGIRRAARDTLQGLVNDFPTYPEYRHALALTQNNLANLLRETGRSEEAEEAYRAALDHHLRLRAAFPSNPRYRSELARSYNNLGILLAKTGRPKEAEEAHRPALELRQGLATEFPSNPNYQGDLANTLSALANLKNGAKEYDAARELVERADSHLQTALRASPKNPMFRRVHRECLMYLADSRLGLQDHVKAAETAEQLAYLGYDPLKDIYPAACYLARCVPLAEADGRLPEALCREQAKAYAERAMQLLHEAVQHGFEAAADLKKNTDLDPLRGRKDFKKLLQELDDRSKP
jgi:serine/threonine-protein kinase